MSGAPVAGIVTYEPEITILRQLVSTIAPEVARIVLVANSPLEDHVVRTLRSDCGGVELIFQPQGRNIGLGAAYSRIVAIAREGGAQRIVLFDQDSTPAVGMVTQLGTMLTRLQEGGQRPAVLGPRPVSASDPITSHKAPTIHRHRSRKAAAGAHAAWFVISSGSLIALDTLADVGDFDADLFVDAIDIEWCLRAWSRGYSCWQADQIVMPHRLGLGTAEMAWPKWKFTLQRPWRLSMYARNQAALLRRSYVPLSWKIRWLGYVCCQIVAFLLIDRGDITRSRALFSGFRAGLRGQLGPPPEIGQNESHRPCTSP